MTDPKTVAEFQQASAKLKEQTRMQTKQQIEMLWSRIGCIAVQCPSCECTQKVQTTKNVTCYHCSAKFHVYPKTGKSRVIWVPEGKLTLLHQIRDLETTGTYTNIL